MQKLGPWKFGPRISERILKEKYLFDTCIIAAVLNQEQGHRHLEDRIAGAPRGSLQRTGCGLRERERKCLMRGWSG